MLGSVQLALHQDLASGWLRLLNGRLRSAVVRLCTTSQKIPDPAHASLMDGNEQAASAA